MKHYKIVFKVKLKSSGFQIGPQTIEKQGANFSNFSLHELLLFKSNPVTNS